MKYTKEDLLPGFTYDSGYTIWQLDHIKGDYAYWYTVDVYNNKTSGIFEEPVENSLISLEAVGIEILKQPKNQFYEIY